MRNEKKRTIVKQIKALGILCFLMGMLCSCGSLEKTGEITESSLAKASDTQKECMLSVYLEGGTGRASVETPALFSYEDTSVKIIMSSPYYDYIKIGNEKYLPVNTEGNSEFVLPLKEGKTELEITADTTAMGTPHEIHYVLHFTWDDDGEKDISNGEIEEREEIGTAENKEETQKENGDPGKNGTFSLPKVEGISFRERKNKCAECFKLYDSKEGYRAIEICDGNGYLIVPEGKTVPEDVPENMQIICQPVDDQYMAATAVMSFYDQMNALDKVGFSSINAEEWYLDRVKEVMQAGDMLYAGKYSQPDYELLLKNGCDLAVESTMILHTPEVKEKLMELGIPVLVDYSSWESEPLGRVEWVCVYGMIAGQEESAQAVFKKQQDLFSPIQVTDGEKKSVVIVYFNSNAQPVVRRKSDYLSKLVELAGGEYALDDRGDINDSPTLTMTTEDFYLQAKDADVLVYNATIDGEITSISDLVAMYPILEEVKAVREGNVYQLNRNLYQETASMGEALQDFYHCIHEEKDAEYTFMTVMSY